METKYLLGTITINAVSETPADAFHAFKPIGNLVRLLSDALTECLAPEHSAMFTLNFKKGIMECHLSAAVICYDEFKEALDKYARIFKSKGYLLTCDYNEVPVLYKEFEIELAYSRSYLAWDTQIILSKDESAQYDVIEIYNEYFKGEFESVNIHSNGSCYLSESLWAGDYDTYYDRIEDFTECMKEHNITTRGIANLYSDGILIGSFEIDGSGMNELYPHV